MGKVITPNTNPMIGKTFRYKENGSTIIRKVLSEKNISGQRLYYVSESNSQGIRVVDADTHDRRFKTTTSRSFRKLRGKLNAVGKIHIVKPGYIQFNF